MSWFTDWQITKYESENEMKHTKGPWFFGLSVDHSHAEVSTEDNFKRIARVDGENIDEMLLNAALISSAPEMLEALTECISLIAVAEHNNAFDTCALPKCGKQMLLKLEALLSKAKGE